MILVLSNKEDVHPTPVIEYLNKNRIKVFRLNTEALITDYKIFWKFFDDAFSFEIQNVNTGLKINSSEILSFWDRRPVSPELTIVESNEDIKQLNLEEALGFLRSLRFFLGKNHFCIGDPLYDRMATSKMLQIQYAKVLGMKSPNTVFTNIRQEIIDFSSMFDYIIIKPILIDNISINNIDYGFYSKRINQYQLLSIDKNDFSQTYSFIQEYIPKSFELRVTAVCNEIFACKIDSQLQEDETGKIDWRQGYEHGLKHSVYELPDRIADFCRQFLKKMNINFGCFDFIVTPEGEYVFLECNSNGQWLWIEEETGLQISQSIAKALIRSSW